MRILYDHQVFSFQQYGGISRYIYEIANQIAGMEGNDVEIFAPFYINEYFRSESKVRPHGVKIPRLPRTGRIVELINAAVSRLLVRPRRDVDIYHETYYSIMNNCPSSAKQIITVYDMIHERFRGHFSKNDPTSRKKVLAVERADHVICISEQTRQDLIELLGVDPAKTSVVHLGFTLTSQGEFVRNAAPPERPFLLYVGSRGGYKNFEGLLQAYAASPRLRDDFDLICFGGGELTIKEQNLLQRLGLSRENVRAVSGDDAGLAKYYKLASAFIYPSLYEGFGIPPLEAMSFDCPVVCSAVSSIPEVVGDAAEMFDPYKPDSIRVAIERVVSDDVLRQILIARGQERIKLFSWKRCAQETLDVYRRVLS
jgi:glycosyltransferase involved in cell wall biosynthesis